MFFKLSTSITVSTYAFLPSSSPSQQSLLSRYLRCVHIAHTDTAAKSLLTLCDPIDGSPLGLCRPWDSPVKNTGVGCHFLLQCMKVKSESEVAQSCPTLSNPMDCKPTRLLHPWDFPNKSTGLGCHCLLRIQTQGHSKSEVLLF